MRLFTPITKPIQTLFSVGFELRGFELLGSGLMAFVLMNCLLMSSLMMTNSYAESQHTHQNERQNKHHAFYNKPSIPLAIEQQAPWFCEQQQQTKVITITSAIEQPSLNVELVMSDGLSNQTSLTFDFTEPASHWQVPITFSCNSSKMEQVYVQSRIDINGKPQQKVFAVHVYQPQQFKMKTQADSHKTPLLSPQKRRIKSMPAEETIINQTP